MDELRREQAAAMRKRLRKLGRFDQGAFVQVQDMAGVLGGLRIVGNHDDGLAVFAIELLQQGNAIDAFFLRWDADNLVSSKGSSTFFCALSIGSKL